MNIPITWETLFSCSFQNTNNAQSRNCSLQLKVPAPLPRFFPMAPSVSDAVASRKLSILDASDLILLDHKTRIDCMLNILICLSSDFHHLVHKIIGEDVLGSLTFFFNKLLSNSFYFFLLLFSIFYFYFYFSGFK